MIEVFSEKTQKVVFPVPTDYERSDEMLVG